MASVIRSLAVRLSMNSAQFRKDIDKVDARMRKFSNGLKRQANFFNGQLATMGLSLASAFGARELTEAADVMVNLRNKLGAVYETSEDVALAMSDIKRIARESRSELDAVGTLYQRLAKASERLEVTQEDVAAVTQVVANTFLLSGTTASEAANSARQFAQGIASGALRGDELRSVLENNVVLGQMLAEAFNKDVGQLRDFAAAGGLTAEKILPALVGKLEETNTAVGQMAVTTSQARVLFNNSFTQMVDRINSAYGITQKYAAFLGVLADNIGVLTAAFVGLGVVLATKLMYAFGAWIVVGVMGAYTAMGTLLGTIMTVIGAFVNLAVGIALPLIKIGLLAAAFYTLYAAVATIVDVFDNVKENFGQLLDEMKVLFDKWKSKFFLSVLKTKQYINDLFSNMGFSAPFEDATNEIAKLERRIINLQGNLDSGGLLNNIGDVFLENFKPLEDAANIFEVIKGTGVEAFDILRNAGSNGFIPAENIKQFETLKDIVMNSQIGQKFQEQIQMIMETIGMSKDQIVKFWKLLNGEDPMKDEKKGEAEETGPFTWADRWKQTVDVIKGYWKDLSGDIKAEIDAMSAKYDTWTEILEAGAKKSKKLSAVRKAVMLREAIISGKKAILDAYATGGPFPANLAAAALVTAQTGMVIRDIMKGQAHDGMDSLPSTGTYMLERGERVVSSRANRDLTQFLADNRNAQSMQQPSNLTLQVNGVSDPDVVVGALSQRMNELQGMMRMLSAENARANFV